MSKDGGPSFFLAFMNTRGEGKALYGTDWPVLLHKQSLAQIEELKEDAKFQLLRDFPGRRATPYSVTT